MTRNLFTFFIALFIFQVVHSQVELGEVQWIRNYNEAIEESVAVDKPVLILFQEVPGCSTCQHYGKSVLSEPLIVDLIEHYFVPLAIFNNHKGHDQEILKKYNEPSWNNPVVRIVNSKGKDLVSRVNGNYSSQGIVQAMMDAMLAEGKLVPESLKLVYDIFSSNPDEELVLSMYCYWSGEKEIGKIPGVYSTEAGYMDGREVVKLSYDPNLSSRASIIKKASESKNATKVYDKAEKFRSSKDNKYYLKNSEYACLPLHPYQAMIMNSAIGSGVHNLDEWLSPSQLAYLQGIRNGDRERQGSLLNMDYKQYWKVLK